MLFRSPASTGARFDIIGPPREIEGLPYFVAMQMTGRGRDGPMYARRRAATVRGPAGEFLELVEITSWTATTLD